MTVGDSGSKGVYDTPPSFLDALVVCLADSARKNSRLCRAAATGPLAGSGSAVSAMSCSSTYQPW